MNRKKLLIIVIIITLVIITPPLAILGSFFIPAFYFQAVYPEWDQFCIDTFFIENYSSYDKELLESIAREAIAAKYPDMLIPDNLVHDGYDEFMLIHLTLEVDFRPMSTDSYPSWSVLIDALEENNIKAEYVGTGCS